MPADDQSDVLWSERLDAGRYIGTVRRITDYTGQLTVTRRIDNHLVAQELVQVPATRAPDKGTVCYWRLRALRHLRSPRHVSDLSPIERSRWAK